MFGISQLWKKKMTLLCKDKVLSNDKTNFYWYKTLSSFLQLTSATLYNSSKTIDHISNIEPMLKHFDLSVDGDASGISSKISFIEISKFVIARLVLLQKLTTRI